ncbi:glycoside hydrolase family 113 [Mycobacterium sp. SMC-4]|uniref:glycoside hydrolase family 113 n=1 Tax=Mycobacterium sp. SMC-4 TaxID=2857059 RepID=UPI003D07D7C9
MFAAAVGVRYFDSGPATGVGHADTSVQIRGFALPSWEVHGYDGPDVEQSLREVKALGANWVQFTPTWYQETRTSSEIYRTEKSVSDAGQERAIQIAHGLGLKVLLKPHLNLAVHGSNKIRPDDRPAWFRSYTDFITHYAAMAQRLGAEQFAVATELSGTTDDRPGWLAVIQAVRDLYDGVLTYASGPDWEHVTFWDALDYIGVHAYAKLSDTPTTDVQALKRAAEPYVERLAALSATYNRKIVFTEAGYTSQRGTTTNPSSWTISKIEDQAEQAAGYETLLSTFGDQPWFGGMFWWVWINPPYSEPDVFDFSPKGKAAEEVIRRWWGV